MRAAALLPGELVIERARLAGNGSRGALEAALAYVRIGDLAGGEEILLIPRLHAREPLSPLRSPGDFGARLTEQLRALRLGATVDPAGPVAGATALRFTSKARYAAWWVALWLHPRPGGEAGQTMPEPSALRGWVAREVLRDGPVLVATAARLARQGLLAAWIVRFDLSELTLAAAALERAYGVPAITGVTETRSAPRPLRPARMVASRSRDEEAQPVPVFEPQEDLGVARDEMARLLGAVWARTIAAESAAAALTPRHARLAQALAVLAVHPNLGRLLAPDALERARVAAAGPVREPERSLDMRPVSGRERRPRPNVKLRSPGASPPGPGSRPRLPVAPALSPGSGSQIEPVAACEPSQRALSSPHGPDAALQHETASDLPRALELVPAAFVTEFGGVFFVVNVLLALGLYPDFTRPRDRGLAPSPFWLLDRLAERLLGRAYRRDPLHRWLAGAGLPGPLPATWEADPRWLAGLSPAVHGLRRSRARTILWDSRGFALFDAPSRRRARLRRYAACGPCIELPPQPRRRLPRDPDARWIACLAEFLVVRLALAGAGLGPHSLRLPGSVTIDEERVEVVFDLARLPIEIRLAGLDRDPGWLPAEGRSLVFKFQ
jgi:hypothetical protein